MQEYLDAGGQGSTGLCQEMLRCLAADMFHGRAFPPKAHIDSITRSLATPADVTPLRLALSAFAGLGAGFKSLSSVDSVLRQAYSARQQQHNRTSDLPPEDNATVEVKEETSLVGQERAHAARALAQARALASRLRQSAGSTPMDAVIQEVRAIVECKAKEEAKEANEEPKAANGEVLRPTAEQHTDWAWGQVMCLCVDITRQCLQRLPPPPPAPTRHHLAEKWSEPVAGLLESILTEWTAHKLQPSVQLYYELMRLLRLRVTMRLVPAGLSSCPPPVPRALP